MNMLMFVTIEDAGNNNNFKIYFNWLTANYILSMPQSKELNKADGNQLMNDIKLKTKTKILP